MTNPVAPAVREYIEIGAGYVVATRGGGSTFRIHGPDKRYAIVSSEYDHPFYTQMAKAIAAEREAASDELERLRAEKADLITACDAALDWADANARAFPIETAPDNKWVEVWCSVNKVWLPVFVFPEWTPGSTVTHWKPTAPPPSNPPLPAPIERLGEVLRKVKGAQRG